MAVMSQSSCVSRAIYLDDRRVCILCRIIFIGVFVASSCIFAGDLPLSAGDLPLRRMILQATVPRATCINSPTCFAYLTVEYRVFRVVLPKRNSRAHSGAGEE